ncbi:hypothetical protein GCM10011579_040770 [Streptomyces albiflavescens]|uniref:DUF397 domain-containing protein n=1 Tax=Streptomyces albiflavescens TaxID=1623582 RepID=A0A918D4Z5_9ACTN|nr:DUF397 domain-containing protein [Streptomyces albiflavescens]GGN67871.1 hypothetical protein GCM10011579_040770 [Streptomyces albiflavescens]
MGHRNPSVLRRHISSDSGDDDCVEVAVVGKAVLVRDSTVLTEPGGDMRVPCRSLP